MPATQMIKTPIPGFFYRRPSPSDDAYAEVGTHISSGDKVALVEIMKSYHTIVSDVDGTVVAFLVEDGDQVSPGQDIIEVSL